MRFIQEGYTDWRRQAAQETELKLRQEFMVGLLQGVRKLGRLQTVRLSGVWPSPRSKLSFIATIPKVDYGSSLARQWSVFEPFPFE